LEVVVVDQLEEEVDLEIMVVQVVVVLDLQLLELVH
jgi:hypothetical protein